MPGELLSEVLHIFLFFQEVPKSFKFGETSTTGHANSPAPIFIGNKTTKTPKVFKRGRKIPLKVISRGGAAMDEVNFEGLAKLMATPGGAKTTTPRSTRGSANMEVEDENTLEEQEEKNDGEGAPKLHWSPRTPTSTTSFISTTSTTATNFTNFDFSTIRTPDVTEDHFISPLVTPRPVSSATPDRITSLNTRGSPLKPTTPEDVPIEEDATTFDFGNVHTPDVSQDAFVSPDSVMKPRMRRSLRTFTQGLMNLREEEEEEVDTLSPKSIKKTSTINLVSASTPKPESSVTSRGRHQQRPSESFVDVRNLFETIVDEDQEGEGTTNKNDESSKVVPCLSESSIEGGDYTDVQGVRRLLRTPEADYTQVAGDKKLMNTPQPIKGSSPTADYTQVAGVKKLMKTPKTTPMTPEADYTQVEGVRKLMKTPKAAANTPKADYTQVAGVRKLMRTPKASEPPLASPKADYTQVAGIKKLLKTPKASPQTPEADYTQVAGVEKLMKTPRSAPETPEADYTQVAGVKKLMTTPRNVPETPEADYTQVAGVKKLMKTPRATPQTPEADYTQVAGVKKLLKTPEPNEESSTLPVADYTQVLGIRRLMKTPKNTPVTPEANYTQVAGVKKLMQTPKPPVPEREADDTHLAGVRKVLRTPKPAVESPKADYTNVVGLRKLMETPQITEDQPQSLPSPDYTGIRKLMRSPKSPSNSRKNSNSYDVTGVKQLLRTPRPEVEPNYTRVQGIHKLLRTPGRIARGPPEADYTDPKGLRKLLATPQTPVNSPEADYSNVHGLRTLMRTPKDKKMSEFDLEGLVQLVKTPLADQTNVVCCRVQMDCLKIQSPSADLSSGSRGKRRKVTMTPEVQTAPPSASATSSPSENIPPVSNGENSETLQETVEGEHTPRRSRRTRAAKSTDSITPVRQMRSRYKKEEVTNDSSINQKDEQDEMISQNLKRKNVQISGDEDEPNDLIVKAEEKNSNHKEQEGKILELASNEVNNTEAPCSSGEDGSTLVDSKEGNTSPEAPYRLLPGRRCTRKNANLENTESLSSPSRPKRRTRKDVVLDTQVELSVSPCTRRRAKMIKKEDEVACVDSPPPVTKASSPVLLPIPEVTAQVVTTPASLRSRRRQPNSAQLITSNETLLTPSKRGRGLNPTPSSEVRQGSSLSKKVDGSACKELQDELENNVATTATDITTPVKRTRRGATAVPRALKTLPKEEEMEVELAEKSVLSTAATPVKRTRRGVEKEEDSANKPLEQEEEEPKRSTRKKADSDHPPAAKKKRVTRSNRGSRQAAEDTEDSKTHDKDTEEPRHKRTRVMQRRGKSNKVVEEEENVTTETTTSTDDSHSLSRDSSEDETHKEDTQPQKRRGRTTRGKQKETKEAQSNSSLSVSAENQESREQKEEEQKTQRGRATRGRQHASKNVSRNFTNHTIIQVL